MFMMRVLNGGDPQASLREISQKFAHECRFPRVSSTNNVDARNRFNGVIHDIFGVAGLTENGNSAGLAAEGCWPVVPAK